MGELVGAAFRYEAGDGGIAVGSPVITPPTQGVASLSDHVRTFVLGWAQVTTGGATTGIRPAVNRFVASLGEVANEDNTEAVKVAAGGTEPFFSLFEEAVTRSAKINYGLGLGAVGGAATRIQVATLVLVLR